MTVSLLNLFAYWKEAYIHTLNSLTMYKKFFACEPHMEGPFPPSAVEPCHNLSLEELLRDYSRGIIYPSKPAMYDPGDELDEVPPQVFDDISEVADFAHSSPRPASRPARANEVQRNEQSKAGTGAEGEQAEGGPEGTGTVPSGQE